MLLSACGSGAGGDTGGAADPKKLDRQQFTALRADMEQVTTEAFDTAARSVDGRVRFGRPELQSCALRGAGVAQLKLRGSLVYKGVGDAASTGSIEKAWADLELDPGVGGDQGLGADRMLTGGVTIGLGVDRPVSIRNGSGETLRSLGASSACFDLGPDLYEEMS